MLIQLANLILEEIFFMTGQMVQDRLDAIVMDLQTKGKGQTINFLFRAIDCFIKLPEDCETGLLAS